MPSMKILCVCQGGNSRSAALGYIFKYKYGQDALACGWEGNTKQTLNMLCEWADLVCVLQTDILKKISEKFHDKTFIYDVGPDRWFNSLHPELIEILEELVQMSIKEGKLLIEHS